MPRAAYLTPVLHVADVFRSIHFYQLLGLELTDYEDDDATCPVWARMHSEGGDVMFLLAETPIRASKDRHPRRETS